LGSPKDGYLLAAGRVDLRRARRVAGARAPHPGKEPKIASALASAEQLRVERVTVRFGGITALDSVSFAVSAGHIVGLIGPNGAGKTTLFNCLSRLYSFDEGEIVFEGRPIVAVPPHGIAALGIGRTFQNLALFRTMTVRQNIMLGGHCRTRSGFFANALRLPQVRREEAALNAHADELIGLLDLAGVAETRVMDLPFGTQKRVELARALASRPKLLLLDEPAGGLNHEEVGGLSALLRGVRDRLGLTMLLVEHHMNMVMRVSDKVVALDFGRVIADGTPAEVQGNAEVIRAYLGTEG
jgi:branched-chain amino acid transport system ATP-binding protein